MVSMSALLLILSTQGILMASAGIIRYDQSQSGDYNVHLDLKNIDVVALLDDATINVGADQYDYDYGELTLKPPAANQTTISANYSSSANETASSAAEQTSSTPSTNNGQQLPTTDSQTSTAKPPRRCGAGFFRDNTGRCRRLRRPIKLGGLLHQNKNKPVVG